jgi:hypothetical protein
MQNNNLFTLLLTSDCRVCDKNHEFHYYNEYA